MGTEITADDIAPGSKNPTAGEVDKPPRDEEEFVNGWLHEIAEARKREKLYRPGATKLVEMYEAAKAEESSYNILFSNTDTLSPALYNSTPRPVVKARFQNKDNALQRFAAMTSERILKYLLDTNSQEYSSFDEVMRQSVLEALVPGRGLLRVKYDAELLEPEEPGEAESPAEVAYEAVCLQEVPWNQYLEGYAKRWQDVPWIAFEHQMTKEELEKNFGEAANGITPTDFASDATEEEHDGSGNGKSSMFGSRTVESKGVALATVYEIWNRTTKEVIFISPQSPRSVPKKVADPLELEGFYPLPKPMTFVPKISGRIPTPLYNLYAAQARELDDISTRITRLVRALRVRGFYDSTVQGLDGLLKSPDNTMTPITNAAQLGAQGISLDKALYIIPIDAIVAALQSLYLQRQQCKAIIFEITGIADIMRGSSAASETLGAQEIKNQWGTLRLKRMQKEVGRFACDTMRIMLEVAVGKLSQETIRAMTGLPFPTAQEKAAAKAQLEAQAAAVAAQPQGMIPGQPIAPPPQPDPELLAVAQAPSWEDILGMLKSDSMRQFTVTIDTNSTVDAEATEDKQDMAELMNSLAQFMNGVAPLVETGALPFEASKALMVNLLRRFRMGGEVEEALMSMQEPQKPAGIDPEAQKQLEAAQQEIEAGKQKLEQGQKALDDAVAKQRMDAEFQRLQDQLRDQEFAQQQEFWRQEQAMLQQQAMRELDMAKREAALEQKLLEKEVLANITLSAKASEAQAAASDTMRQAKAGADETVAAAKTKVQAEQLAAKPAAAPTPAPEDNVDLQEILRLLKTPRVRTPVYDPKTGRISQVIDSVDAKPAKAKAS